MANDYNFYYQGAFREYILQFMRLFSGFKVEIGEETDGSPKYRTCPVHYGDMDRVVANVLRSDGVFVPNHLPIMSGVLTGVELSPENRHTNYHEDNTTRIRGTDNVRVNNTRLVGVPYKMSMDLSIYTSNTTQMFQLLEQILLLFNPKITIQKSEHLLDWAYLTEVELLSVVQETNTPAGPDERMIVWTLSFIVDVWLDFPMKESESIVQQIFTTIKDNKYDDIGVDLETFIVDQNS